MKFLSFISKVTFFYNLCMLATLMLRYFNFIPDGDVKSTVLVAGFILSVIFNTLSTVVLVWLLVHRKPGSRFSPLWLFLFNFLCFIFQLYLLIR